MRSDVSNPSFELLQPEVVLRGQSLSPRADVGVLLEVGAPHHNRPRNESVFPPENHPRFHRRRASCLFPLQLFPSRRPAYQVTSPLYGREQAGRRKLGRVVVHVKSQNPFHVRELHYSGVYKFTLTTGCDRCVGVCHSIAGSQRRAGRDKPRHKMIFGPRRGPCVQLPILKCSKQ
jgi:hypothetical protein